MSKTVSGFFLTLKVQFIALLSVLQQLLGLCSRTGVFQQSKSRYCKLLLIGAVMCDTEMELSYASLSFEESQLQNPLQRAQSPTDYGVCSALSGYPISLCV